jgi:hypothetical protein
MSYKFLDSFGAGSGWNPDPAAARKLSKELSETCGVSLQNKFEKLVHLVGFITRIRVNFKCVVALCVTITK